MEKKNCEIHHMTHVGSDEDEDEYLCTTCGRRLVFNRTTRKKTVKAEGDREALHTGSVGMEPPGMSVVPPDPEMPDAEDGTRLERFEDFLRGKVNFD